MRPLEATLAGLLTLSAISLFIPPVRRYRWVHLLPSSAILLTTVQLLFEGYRWQMVPLYCITVMLALMTAPSGWRGPGGLGIPETSARVRNPPNRPRRSGSRRTIGEVMLRAAVASGLLRWGAVRLGSADQRKDLIDSV